MGKKGYLQPFFPPDMISKTHMLTTQSCGPHHGDGVGRCSIGFAWAQSWMEFNTVELEQTRAKKKKHGLAESTY